MQLSQLLGVALLGLLAGAPIWAQEQSQATCPHPKSWKPTSEELQRVVAAHHQWLEKIKEWEQKVKAAPAMPFPVEGRANLCNADLQEANLISVNLYAANLNGANLTGADLNQAILMTADLIGASLIGVKVAGANLARANLTGASLSWTNLNGAKLTGANLNGANLIAAHLQGANLNEASLIGAYLNGANLTDANLSKAALNNADLSSAALNNAALSAATLNGANLRYASVAGAHFDNADLADADYAPNSAAPDPYVAGIKGLDTVKFPAGEEVGLVQLRDLLQKAGLRDLEREATFAIESGKSRNSITNWKENPRGAAEGILRKIAFDFTTRYGLNPGRALMIAIMVWVLLIPVYSWPIWRPPRTTPESGIYRIWPKERVEIRDGKPSFDNSARVERLHMR